MNKKGGAFIVFIAWAGFVLALGALILGWLAYNRPPGQQDPSLRQDLSDMYDEFYQKS
jgi:hypothetical protein